MAENSKILWTHHTFNPVWGCVKIVPECAGCYAQTFAHRMNFNVWGKDAPRRILSDSYWQQPLKWNRQAEKEGQRKRVFCGSMCDWLEDNPIVTQERQRLFPLIENTPWLDWLLLSKRNENFERFIPEAWLFGDMPENVWIGMSAGLQKTWGASWPILESIKYNHHRLVFVSVEPMIGPLNIQDDLAYIDAGDEDCPRWLQWPDWIIIGGESEQPGWKARELDLQWVRDLIAQARQVGIAVFIKQLGSVWARKQGIESIDPKADDWNYWPDDLRIREFPERMEFNL